MLGDFRGQPLIKGRDGRERYRRDPSCWLTSPGITGMRQGVDAPYHHYQLLEPSHWCLRQLTITDHTISSRPAIHRRLTKPLHPVQGKQPCSVVLPDLRQCHVCLHRPHHFRWHQVGQLLRAQPVTSSPMVLRQPMWCACLWEQGRAERGWSTIEAVASTTLTLSAPIPDCSPAMRLTSSPQLVGWGRGGPLPGFMGRVLR